MPSQILIDRFLRGESSHPHNLHAHEKLILFFLASYMGKKSNCYPSEKSLAIDCSLSIDSIKRSIKSLERKKLITVTRSWGRNNHYTFNLAMIDQLGADGTQCPQPLDADSALNLAPIASTPSADSPPNNIKNNNTRLYEKSPPNPRGADRGAHVQSSNL